MQLSPCRARLMELVDIQDLKTPFSGLWIIALLSRKPNKYSVLGTEVEKAVAGRFMA
jgi:hypothetical protein